MANKSLLITDRVNCLASIEAEHRHAEIVYVDPASFFHRLSGEFIGTFGSQLGNDLLHRAYDGTASEQESARVCFTYYTALLAAVSENPLNRGKYAAGIDLEQLREVVLERGVLDHHFVFGHLLRLWLKDSNVPLHEYEAIRTSAA